MPVMFRKLAFLVVAIGLSAGTADARIVLLVENTPGASSGKAYFDNITVTQINPPATGPDFNNDSQTNFSDYPKLAGD